MAALAAVPVAAEAASIRPARVIIDFRNASGAALIHPLRDSQVFVDGREIHLAWFVDTSGTVKTYDVLRDKKVHAVWDIVTKQGEAPAVHDGTEILEHGLLSLTLHGRVELKPRETSASMPGSPAGPLSAPDPTA